MESSSGRDNGDAYVAEVCRALATPAVRGHQHDFIFDALVASGAYLVANMQITGVQMYDTIKQDAGVQELETSTFTLW